MTSLQHSELADILAATALEFEIVGAQTAVSIDGELVAASTGVANTDLGTAVMDDTVFQIGSTTKVWTAMLLMQLVDEGRVDLDTPVTAYLPDVRLAAGDAWRAITPRQLLSMSSGMDSGPYARTGRGDDAIENYVAILADIPLVFEPGKTYGYSNASTNVTGLLIERLRGMSWDDVLRAHIIDRGGFLEAVSLFEDLPYYRVAVGKFPGDARAHRPWHFGRGMGPTGSTLATSGRDLARFGESFLRDGIAPNGERLLSAEAVRTMQTPQVAVPPSSFATSWCTGPYHLDWDGVDVFGHVGTSENGSSELRWIPELGISIAVIHNTVAHASAFLSAMFHRVLRDRLGVAIPAAPNPDHFDPVDPAPYLGRYEALGRRYDVSTRDGDLTLTVEREVATAAGDRPWETVSSALRPVGRHRFLAVDPVVTWNFAWEIAFTVDGDGCGLVLHNGAFAAGRVSEAASRS
jgi:CubicO group peptidase (beta-lactamase class C family)